MKREVATVVSLLLVATLVALPSAHAVTVTVEVSGDQATIVADIVANLTHVPKSVCNYYKRFYTYMWGNRMYRGGTLNILRDQIAGYMRKTLAIPDAKVEDINLTVTVDENVATVALPLTVFENATGALVGGDMSLLATADNKSVVVEALNSSNIMTIEVLANFTIPSDVPIDKVSDLVIHVAGNLSKVVNVASVISVYNFEKSQWDPVDTSLLNTTDYAHAALTVPLLEHQKNRIVMLKIDIVDSQSYPSTPVRLSLDQLSVDVSYNVMVIREHLELTVSGVVVAKAFRSIVNARFRWMAPDTNMTYNGYAVNPARLFFINFKAFDVPLEKWNRKYNGTHTVFYYNVSSAVVYTFSNHQITVDPSEEIIVPGYATASGDEIYIQHLAITVPLAPLMLLFVAALAVVVAVLVAKLSLRAGKHYICAEREKRRRFVKRRY